MPDLYSRPQDELFHPRPLRLRFEFMDSMGQMQELASMPITSAARLEVYRTSEGGDERAFVVQVDYRHGDTLPDFLMNLMKNYGIALYKDSAGAMAKSSMSMTVPPSLPPAVPAEEDLGREALALLRQWAQLADERKYTPANGADDGSLSKRYQDTLTRMREIGRGTV